MMTDKEFKTLATKAFNLMVENIGENTSSGALENRYRHSVRVGRYMKKFAEEINDDYTFIKECVVAGLFHDIKKFTSNNHGKDASKILEKDPELKEFKRAINAIRIHSLKQLPEEVELDDVSKLLMDCDALDKFSFDVLCISVSKESGLEGRINTLYSKRAVLSKYSIKYEHKLIQEEFEKGFDRLNTFIKNMEMDL